MDTQRSVHRFGYSPTEAAVATGSAWTALFQLLGTRVTYCEFLPFLMEFEPQVVPQLEAALAAEHGSVKPAESDEAQPQAAVN